jgi:hypothetical protein
MLEHGGNTYGFTSDLSFLPNKGIGITVLTNQRGSVLNQLIRYRLLELMYQQEPEFETLVKFQLDMQTQALKELLSGMQEKINVTAIELYLGHYNSTSLGNITIGMQDGKLIFDIGEFESEIKSLVNEEGRVSYIIYDSVLAGLAVRMTKDDSDRPTLIVGSGVNEYTFEKVG